MFFVVKGPVKEVAGSVAPGRREAPKARRASGNPRAQLCCALGYKENNIIFFGLAAGTDEKDKTLIRALMLFINLLALGFTESSSHISKFSNDVKQASLLEGLPYFRLLTFLNRTGATYAE